ncbi:SDR family oxidoreductase [Arthrobacter sp. 35W]|uniref:SDR family oxidoreductase n=1 Tax=Arthrobacter sp. 35W TaxID=1132441 RepID=UPI0003FEFE82|nr:SDR family oxidoreductase [Arthrobacter sp. 35W]
MTNPSLVLATGATGYVGGRLVPLLLAAGYTVRLLVRSPGKLAGVPWRDDVEIVQGDLSIPESLPAALGGVHTVFYLVHSMGSGRDFEAMELRQAAAMAAAAETAHVKRIVYLGGLHRKGDHLSTHMRSRAAVGETFLAGAVPAVVFQAGIITGSGSASFEMVRHLTENLPLMPAPSWVANLVEPIAIRDVLHYLVAAPSLPAALNRTFDIGSGETFTYAAMMYGYAHEAGLSQRYVFALPIPAPKLAGWWVALATPIPHSMAVPLVESLQNDAVAGEHDIDGVIPRPDGGLTGYRESLRLALGKIDAGTVETTWASASGNAPSQPLPSDPEWAGQSVYTDRRERRSTVAPRHVWAVIEGIGGLNGWYSWPAAWVVRGLADKLVGGAGHNRGRRHASRLQPGDAVDWWRVETLEPGHLLRLRAEMKVPGDAWLEFAAEPDGGGTVYIQRAIYFPRGVLGKLYWWAILPFHGLIFPSMARNILAKAAHLESAAEQGPAAGLEPGGRTPPPGGGG